MDTPQPPPSRVEYELPFGSLWFKDMDEFLAWKAEPLWRKILGLTAYDRRLNGYNR